MKKSKQHPVPTGATIKQLTARGEHKKKITSHGK
jgi:hypothetical protein